MKRLFVCLMLLCLFGCSPKTETAESSTPSNSNIGKVVNLRAPQSTSTLLFEDQASMEDANKAVAANDPVGYKQLADRKGFLVADRVPVLVLDTTLTGLAKVRVQSGPQMDKVGWMPVEWLNDK